MIRIYVMGCDCERDNSQGSFLLSSLSGSPCCLRGILDASVFHGRVRALSGVAAPLRLSSRATSETASGPFKGGEAPGLSHAF
jgi:hypothetical protein